MPVKLQLKEQKFHKDDLPESHFVELRQFLQKKHRAEAIAAKMNAKTGRGGSIRAPARNQNNDDLTLQAQISTNTREI